MADKRNAQDERAGEEAVLFFADGGSSARRAGVALLAGWHCHPVYLPWLGAAGPPILFRKKVS